MDVVARGKSSFFVFSLYSAYPTEQSSFGPQRAGQIKSSALTEQKVEYHIFAFLSIELYTKNGENNAKTLFFQPKIRYGIGIFISLYDHALYSWLEKALK
jgi:hypothetical protein